jgi:uncharacterized protein (DUF58 family)
VHYLDPVSLAKLRNLRLDLRRRVMEGHWAGRHRSSLRGFASEFAQHRAYVPGDELRRLDWKVYARKDRFFVREYQEEKSLRAQVLLDASGSMSFSGQGRPSKWDYACRLSAALAYLVLSEGDAAGLAVFDSQERLFLPPRGGWPQIDVIDRALADLRPGGETDLVSVLRRTALRLPRRSLVMLISDLLGDPQEFLSLVKALRARRQEVFVLQVLDPDERDLPYEGPALFEGLEDSALLRCEVSLVRAGYQELFEKRRRLYEASLHACGVRFGVFYTDRPWDAALTRYLSGASVC